MQNIRVTSLTGLLLVLVTACDGGNEDAQRPPAETGPYVSEVSDGLGAAVVVLLDNSGSMKDKVPRESERKHVVARRAIETMLGATEAFLAKTPDQVIKIGLMHFSGTVATDLPIADYSSERVRSALTRVPAPDGYTAIGDAMLEARRALYKSGCIRKNILVITDGENTRGSDPERVGREIDRRSGGGVRIYFVAFDTDPKKFAFLREIGGDVLPAKSATQLSAALKEIYEGRILAEAMPEEPERPR